jgi:hypothetical protein
MGDQLQLMHRSGALSHEARDGKRSLGGCERRHPIGVRFDFSSDRAQEVRALCRGARAVCFEGVIRSLQRVPDGVGGRLREGGLDRLASGRIDRVKAGRGREECAA